MSGQSNQSWVPEIGEVYYTPNYGEEVKYQRFINTGTPWDKFIIKHEKIFKTKEEAINCSNGVNNKLAKENK